MKVWTKLVKEGVVKETVFGVKLEEEADVDDFRKAVLVKLSNTLKGYDSTDLAIYTNEEAFKGSLKMKASQRMSGLGQSEETAVFAVIPRSNDSISHSTLLSNVSSLQNLPLYSEYMYDGIDIRKPHLQRNEVIAKR